MASMMDAPKPTRARLPKDDVIAMSGPAERLNDIWQRGRARDRRLGLDIASPEGRLAAVAQGHGRGDEAVEQRMRPLGPALELRVELAGDEPRVVAQLHDLHEPSIRRLAGQDHPRSFQERSIAVVHLEAVAVAFVDHLVAVDRMGLG